jgi:hypothetical protein
VAGQGPSRYGAIFDHTGDDASLLLSDHPEDYHASRLDGIEELGPGLVALRRMADIQATSTGATRSASLGPNGRKAWGWAALTSPFRSIWMAPSTPNGGRFSIRCSRRERLRGWKPRCELGLTR